MKYFVGMAFIYIMGTMFSLMIEGSSGIATANLTASVTATEGYLPIDSANGLNASANRMFIEAEEFSYTSIQTIVDGNCASGLCLVVGARGINDSDATAHASAKRVYTEATGLINLMAQLRIAEFANSSNPLEFITGVAHVAGAFGKFVGQVVLWNYSFLEGNAVYLKYVLFYPLGLGLVIQGISLIRNGT